MSVNTGTYLPFLSGSAFVTQQYLETILVPYVTNTEVASGYVAINSAASLKSVNASTGTFNLLKAGTGAFTGLTASSSVSGTGAFTNIIFNGPTAASASAGTITIPVTAAGYMDVRVGATVFKVPYYNS